MVERISCFTSSLVILLSSLSGNNVRCLILEGDDSCFILCFLVGEGVTGAAAIVAVLVEDLV